MDDTRRDETRRCTLIIRYLHFNIGRIVLKVRTTPSDPFYAPYFDGKRRTFEFQLQGQFKQQPKGELFMGGEVPQPMHLGDLSIYLLSLPLISVLIRFNQD